MCGNTPKEKTKGPTIINQDAALRNYLEAFRSKFSAPPWKYVKTLQMGMLPCDGSKTPSGRLRQSAVPVTMSSLNGICLSFPANQDMAQESHPLKSYFFEFICI